MNRIRTFSIVFILLPALAGSGCSSVRTGLDNIDAYRSLFENKRVGIITNHTAYDRDGTYILDIFRNMDTVTVTALFGPEHGFEGIHQDGEKVASAAAGEQMPPVYSLYGENRKPTAEMLEKVDVLVFDIQDIGTRYYTYIYTMALAMEAAAMHGRPFVVLDRPNPITATCVQGNVLDTEFSTFVGLYPIATRHGMTVGELARLFNGAGWLEGGVKADLVVIPMTGYSPSDWYDQTGLKFIKPSPNMPSVEAAALYPGTCLLEGTGYSEGRGTDSPFSIFGAPWVNASDLTARLNALNLSGVRFEPITFTPTFSKHANHACQGSKIVISDREAIDPFWIGIHIIDTLHTLYPQQIEWKIRHFDRLCGTDKIRKAMINEESLDDLKTEFQQQLNDFMQLRRTYLIYDRDKYAPRQNP